LIVLVWAEQVLGISLSNSTLLMVVVAIGIAIGAIGSAAIVPLKKALKVMKLGVVMGITCALLALYNKQYIPDVGLSFTFRNELISIPLYLILACFILLLLGMLAGFFMVPMNALLQHRGHVRLTAGQSIAVQNFNENLGILIMLFLYALLLKLQLPLQAIMVLFGVSVAAAMYAVILWNKANMRKYDWTQLIGEEKHH
ncbi:MAG: lysophospholipid transporter LplT, partial [Saezia sp.]